MRMYVFVAVIVWVGSGCGSNDKADFCVPIGDHVLELFRARAASTVVHVQPDGTTKKGGDLSEDAWSRYAIRVGLPWGVEDQKKHFRQQCRMGPKTEPDGRACALASKTFEELGRCKGFEVWHSEPEPPKRQIGVDRDCYEAGMICNTARLADAEALVGLVAPTMALEGWVAGCYELRYVAGGSGEKNAISVNVHGAPHAGTDRCADSSAGAPLKTHLTKLAQKLKAVVAGHSLVRDVDRLQATDGGGVAVEVPLRK